MHNEWSMLDTELVHIVVSNTVTCFISKVEVEMLNDMLICLFLIF